MSEREKRSKRRAWKISSKTCRDRTKKITAALKLTMTPPTTPPDNGTGPSREIQNRNRGRRKKNLNRSKAYRDQFKLRITFNTERGIKDIYKKRYYRLKNMNIKRTESQIDNEVERIINDIAKIKTAITMYSILKDNTRKRYSKAETANKRMLKKLIYKKAVLRQYGIGDFAKKATRISESRIRVHTNTPQRQRSTAFQKNITDFFERDDKTRESRPERNQPSQEEK
ncbi:hypothetical protein DPMN_044271 [Dreissena polymorpha]|uniref:Uncharacterized protein n=1 Tax=Dreissena polymorpha TaxID=45954 RepID=A0A9D4HYN9_DREPO|nr:hypothetical protein DPMN_044271 [Dreissena polymorpha]